MSMSRAEFAAARQRRGPQALCVCGATAQAHAGTGEGPWPSPITGCPDFKLYRPGARSFAQVAHVGWFKGDLYAAYAECGTPVYFYSDKADADQRVLWANEYPHLWLQEARDAGARV